MLTTDQIKSLKQNNISVDPEITKQHTQQVWKAAKNAVKNDVIALAECAKGTVYRVFQTGSISIKLAIAIGQVLNVSPYYLTGEADKPGEFSEALLLQLLEQHGYKKLLAEIALPAEEAPKPKRKYTRKQKAVAEEAVVESEIEAVPDSEPEIASEPEIVPEPEVIAEPDPVIEDVPATTVDIDISEEDMQALLHSLVILDRAGIAVAQEKLARVKGILVS